MTNLNRTVSRVSDRVTFDAGKMREIVITMKPPGLVGFRAKGCRKTYWLTAEVCYDIAVKQEVLETKKQKRLERKLNRGKKYKRNRS